MFASLTREELAVLCATMSRALYTAHAAIARSKSLGEWNARRDVHADLMLTQPDLWRACHQLAPVAQVSG